MKVTTCFLHWNPLSLSFAASGAGPKFFSLKVGTWWALTSSGIGTARSAILASLFCRMCSLSTGRNSVTPIALWRVLQNSVDARLLFVAGRAWRRTRTFDC
jgi:hypothetical protein